MSSSTSSSTAVMDRVSITKPSKYVVIFHNDDKTPMDFVIYVLKSIFRKSDQDAYQLTMAVHHTGSAVVAIYSREIAEQKVEETTIAASRYGYPLKVTAEPQD